MFWKTNGNALVLKEVLSPETKNKSDDYEFKNSETGNGFQVTSRTDAPDEQNLLLQKNIDLSSAEESKTLRL